MSSVNIGVLISGSGSNLQSIIDKTKVEDINGQVKLVISNNSDAYGLVRAEKENIKGIFLNPADYEDNSQYEEDLIELLKAEDIGLIVLAGYMRILSPKFVKEFKNKIINIHPSLIPSFSGDGFYGMRVHKSALEYGVKVSGATVHFVDEGTDTGPIILQETVKIYDGDTPETLQKRVLEVEHRLLPEAVRLFCQDKLNIKGRIVKGANDEKSID